MGRHAVGHHLRFTFWLTFHALIFFRDIRNVFRNIWNGGRGRPVEVLYARETTFTFFLHLPRPEAKILCRA